LYVTLHPASNLNASLAEGHDGLSNCRQLIASATTAMAREPNRMGAWRMVGGYGYGRVDMRIDAEGRPWILEVNANPDFAPDAGFARMARAAGIEYPALVRAISELALERSRAAPSTETHWLLARQLSGVSPPRDAGVLDLFAAEAG
jgi:hypothetical protein